MTAARKPGAPAYTMDKKAVYRGGKKVGVVQNGSFQVVDEHGKQHAGSFAKLIQEHVTARLANGAAGPSGRLRFDGVTAEVMGGKVFIGGKQVGSVDSTWRYAVTHQGAKHEGDVNATPGVVWLGGPGKTGVISLAGLTFTATDGAIHDGPELVGWLQQTGRFRIVRNNGDYLEGVLGQPATFIFLRRQPGK